MNRSDKPGERERFERAVLTHLDAAYNLARWLLRDDARAQDAVQDASLRAFRSFDTMNGPTPKAWFMTIVRNACLSAMKRDQPHRDHDPYDDDMHAQPVLDRSGQIESPESLALRAADTRLLAAGLAALPTEFREVLVLRELEELSYREISVIVGVPIGTVMSRLSRARERLARQMLGPDRKVC